MPYIPKEDREKVNPGGKGLYILEELDENGRFAYLLYKTVIDNKYEDDEELAGMLWEMSEDFFNITEKRYRNGRNILGDLLVTKLEYMENNRPCRASGLVVITIDRVIRRFWKEVLAPYERSKREENGDV